MGPKFQAGDIVKLFSGGPDMTVKSVHFDLMANEYDYNMFDCIWFEKNKDGKKEVHYCPFYSEEIIRVEELV